MADQQEVRQAISLLLAAYPRANNDDQDAMRQYLHLVENLLIQYPSEMVASLASPRTGIVTECVHFPTLAEIKKFMDREWGRIMPRRALEEQEEVRRLQAPDPLPEYSAEHRAMMLQKFRDLSKELSGSGKDKEPTMSKEEYQAKLEANLERIAEEAKTTPPPPLSPTLRKILNLP
jgi:hypothetical protein